MQDLHLGSAFLGCQLLLPIQSPYRTGLTQCTGESIDAARSLLETLHRLPKCYSEGLLGAHACRAAVKATSSPAAAAAVLSNLAALLLSAGRLNECLSVIDDCLKISTGANLQQTVFFAGENKAPFSCSSSLQHNLTIS